MVCTDRCVTLNGRRYHTHDCWPLHDVACRVDQKALENIDPNDGGPTRDDALRRSKGLF